MIFALNFFLVASSKKEFHVLDRYGSPVPR